MPSPNTLRHLLLVAIAAVLAGCASVPPPTLPAPLRAPLPAPALEALDAAERPAPARIIEGPRAEAAAVAVIDPPRSPVPPGGAPVELALDAVNLTAFIDEVFGNQLGFSLEIEQPVRDKPELVTLRLVEPEPPERLYEIAVAVLRRYGIAVIEEANRLRFTTTAAALIEPPQLLSARALPEVPAGIRPVFVFMPLDVVEPGRVAAQLRTLFGAAVGANFQVSEMVENNALLLSGPPLLVNAALEAAQLLDRSGLRDKRSLRITPSYLSVEVLSRELREVLQGQGFSVRAGPGTGGVLTFVAVASANALIVFSESEVALAAAVEWAETLDQPAVGADAKAGAFIYQVHHTTAMSLFATMAALIGADPGATPRAAGAPPPVAGAAAGAFDQARAAGAAGGPGGGSGPTPSVSVGADGSSIIVDPLRNAIIFQGTASRWRMLRSVLERLDQPARQVLIEVTVAEVTLTDEFAHGVEWALRNAGIDDFGGALSVLAGSVANRGLVWRPISESGQVRAVMNLFADSSRVSILSTPRLMVRSGESASIDVGTEVPIITSQATAPDLGGVTPSILQQVQYRKTGVLLQISPMVHSSQRVDLEVSQEVSEAQPTGTSPIPSPSIFSRRLSTSLSLADGQAMLMGGLISDTSSRAGQRVPGLARIPLLGHLFANQSRSGTRTELVVLITPYVVEDAAAASAITEALRSRLGHWPP